MASNNDTSAKYGGLEGEARFPSSLQPAAMTSAASAMKLIRMILGIGEICIAMGHGLA